MKTAFHKAGRLAFAALFVTLVSILAVMASGKALPDGWATTAEVAQASVGSFSPLPVALSVGQASAAAAPATSVGTAPSPAAASAAHPIMPVSQVSEVEGTPIVNRLVEDGSFATWDVIIRLPDGSFLPAHESGLNVKLLKEAYAYAELALNLGKSITLAGRIDQLGFLQLEKVGFGEGHTYLIDVGETQEVQVPMAPEAKPESFQAVSIPKLMEDKTLAGQAVEVKGIPAASKFEFSQGVGVWNLLVSDQKVILLAYESGYNIDLLSRLAALGELAHQTGRTLTLQGEFDADAQILNLRRIISPDGRVFDTDLGDRPAAQAAQQYKTPEVVVVEKQAPEQPEGTVKIIEKEVPVYVEREVPVYIDREVPVYVECPVYVHDHYPVFIHWDPWWYARSRHICVYKNYFIFEDVAVVNIFPDNGDVNFNQVVVVNQTTETNVNQSSNTVVVNRPPGHLPRWREFWRRHHSKEETIGARLRHEDKRPPGLIPKRTPVIAKPRRESHDLNLLGGRIQNKPQTTSRYELTGQKPTEHQRVAPSKLTPKSEAGRWATARMSVTRTTEPKISTTPKVPTSLNRRTASSHRNARSLPQATETKPSLAQILQARRQRLSESSTRKTTLRPRGAPTVPSPARSGRKPEATSLPRTNSALRITPVAGKRYTTSPARTRSSASSRLHSILRPSALTQHAPAETELTEEAISATRSSRPSLRASRKQR